jgi:hypothetical protein
VPGNAGRMRGGAVLIKLANPCSAKKYPNDINAYFHSLQIFFHPHRSQSMACKPKNLHRAFQSANPAARSDRPTIRLKTSNINKNIL